jgi:hypothetical protein
MIFLDYYVIIANRIINPNSIIDVEEKRYNRNYTKIKSAYTLLRTLDFVSVLEQIQDQNGFHNEVSRSEDDLREQACAQLDGEDIENKKTYQDPNKNEVLGYSSYFFFQSSSVCRRSN